MRDERRQLRPLSAQPAGNVPVEQDRPVHARAPQEALPLLKSTPPRFGAEGLSISRGLMFFVPICYTRVAERHFFMKEGGIHISLGAHTLGTLFGIPITNTLVTSLVVMVILIILGVLIGRRLLLVPRGLQNAFEAIVEYMIAMMEETLESRKLAVRYFPLIMTIFLFILFSNMFDFCRSLDRLDSKKEANSSRFFIR